MEQPIDCKNELSIDSRAALSSGCDAKIVHDTTKAEAAMRMTTNTSGSVLDEHGKMIGLEHEMWVNKEGTANTTKIIPIEFNSPNWPESNRVKKREIDVCSTITIGVQDLNVLVDCRIHSSVEDRYDVVNLPYFES